MRFIDGSCGTGKTEAYIKYIKNYSTGKVMIVVETISLCNDIQDRCKNIGIDVNKITSELNWKLMSDGKKKKIIEDVTTIGLFYKSLKSNCDVWIITWATYKQIDQFTLSVFQDIFIDDIRQVTNFIKFEDLAEQSFVIVDLFEIVNEHSCINLRHIRNKKLGKNTNVPDIFEYYEIRFAYDMEYLGKSVYGYFRENLRNLYYNSKSHTLYVEKKMWDNISSNNFDTSNKDSSNENNALNIYMSPNIELLFPSNCTIVGEGLFSYDGDIFLEGNNEITSIMFNRGYRKFQYHLASKFLKKIEKNEKHLARIQYCSEDRISRHKLDKIKENDDVTILHHISKITNYYFNSIDKTYIYIANLDYKNSNICPSGKLIQTINRGLNTFSSYDGVACLTVMSLSYKDQDLKWHIDGISPDQDRINGQFSNELQTIMRTKLRKMIGNNSVFEQETVTDIVLLDIESANFITSKLQDYFNVSVNFIEGGLVKKDNYETKVRKKKFENLIESMTSIGEDTKELDDSNIIIGLLGNIYTKSEHISYQCFDDFFAFRKQMKKFYTHNIVESKEDNVLLSNTIFKDVGDDSKRDIDNVHFTNMIMLDFDDSPITGKSMSSILRKLRYSGFVYSTSSNENGVSNRYRAVLEVKDNIRMTSDVYKRVCQRVKDEIETVIKCESGIDTSKFTSTSLFYMPCQIKGKEDQSFFYNLSQKHEKYGIDISGIISELTNEEIVVYERLVNVDRFDDINRINVEKVLTGKYRSYFGIWERFLKLVSCLHSYGMSSEEIHQILPAICTNLGKYKKTSKTIEKICNNKRHVSMGWLNNEIKKLEYNR